MKNVEVEYSALGPLDGRYHDIGERLAPYFSEFALMRYRVQVEVEWLIFLVSILHEDDLPPGATKLNEDDCRVLRAYYTDFNARSMQLIKRIEAQTNHDVKAVELAIDVWLQQGRLDTLNPLVHIGCTSEDINNLAYALMIKEAMGDVWKKDATNLIGKLDQLANKWASIPMLGHTHGQPATPTTLGKEICVMATRLKRAFDAVKRIAVMGKFNGATGTYGAISLAYPDGYNWIELSHDFVRELGLKFNAHTTQIEPHDWIAEMLDAIRRFNNIVRNIDQDMWTYISMEYLAQAPKAGEVGSSTMPHKVNPIRFENSEANCEMSNGLCQTLADQLMNSRMQRDLSDSSLMRNVGLAVGYSVQAMKYCLEGLNRVSPGEYKLSADLDEHWEVLAEAIQTILRKHGVQNAYDKLKEATRGKEITREDIRKFISDISAKMSDNPKISSDLKRLEDMAPRHYIGKAVEIIKFETH